MNILLAEGPAGFHEKYWNWCHRSEVVGVHAMVCDRPCECGCAKSFSGIFSHKATTHALVAEMPDSIVQTYIDDFKQAYTKAWQNCPRIVDKAVASFDKLLTRTLPTFKAGDIVRVDKTEITTLFLVVTLPWLEKGVQL